MRVGCRRKQDGCVGRRRWALLGFRRGHCRTCSAGHGRFCMSGAKGRGRLCAAGATWAELLHLGHTKGSAAGMGNKIKSLALCAGALLFHCMHPVKAPAQLSRPHPPPTRMALHTQSMHFEQVQNMLYATYVLTAALHDCSISPRTSAWRCFETCFMLPTSLVPHLCATVAGLYQG